MSFIITGADLKFEWISSPEQFKKLEAFADSFGHKIFKSTSPYVAIKRGDRWIGYAQINREPVVFTSWHTDKNICTTRDVVEGFKAFQGWAKIQHGGGLSAVPLNTETFLPHVMSKLGFKRCNCELYETTAE